MVRGVSGAIVTRFMGETKVAATEPPPDPPIQPATCRCGYMPSVTRQITEGDPPSEVWLVCCTKCFKSWSQGRTRDEAVRSWGVQVEPHPPEEKPAGCRHPEDQRQAGRRVPLRWGSAATEVCGACGQYRLLHGNPQWQEGPIPEEDDDDDC